MKNKWVVVTSFLALALVHGSSQTGGGGGTSGGGASGGATTSGGAGAQGGATVNPQTGAQNPQQVPPGRQNPNQLPPGVQNQQQLPPGLQREQSPPGLGASTNQGSFTNQFAGNTNRFGFDTNMSPTGAAGTNRVYSTNHFDHRQFDRSRFRDEAITPADQSLLIRIKQTIITEISVSTSGGGHWAPIHCGIHSGHVRLMGLARSEAEAQRIQSMVSQMPGVSGVENAMSTLPPDQALTETDRAILSQIRQIIPVSQPPAPWTPVSFDVRQAAVGIVGIVPTMQESQRIEVVVRHVPGVVQTSNSLVVDTSSSTGVTPTSTVPQ